MVLACLGFLNQRLRGFIKELFCFSVSALAGICPIALGFIRFKNARTREKLLLIPMSFFPLTRRHNVFNTEAL
jgi:hypothetical protein